MSDPRTAATLANDPACANDIAAANQLRRRIAIRRAATAARLITEIFPSAQRFTLHRQEGWVSVEFVPVSIRDADARLLWFNTDHFGGDQPLPDGPEPIDDSALPAASAPPDSPSLDGPALEAIVLLVDAAASWHPDVIDATDSGTPEDQISDVDLRVLDLGKVLADVAQLDAHGHDAGPGF